MTYLSSIVFARRIAMVVRPGRIARGLLAMVFALACGAALAQGAAANDASFDHAKTGFFLGAQHATARCESCHTQGIFRGTPRECAQCHRNASRPTATQFPVRHIPTSEACDNCHRASVWNVVNFKHRGVTKGTCNTCHDGYFATGKPASHQPVIGSCDLCHNTLTWTATRYDHTGVPKGSCANCHNNVLARGKGVRHPPDGNRTCDTCHSTSLWIPATYPHEPDVWGRCSTCHDNVTARGKSAAHIPDNRQCDTCHGSTSNFAVRTMNHTGLAGQCSTCHNATYVSQNALAMPAFPRHVTTAAQCDTCHRTVAWSPANYTHEATASGTCNTCHTGAPAQGKSASHIPTTAQCDVCHFGTSGFAGAQMNHAGMAGQCSNCHNGNPSYLAQNAQAKSPTHVPTNAQCDSSGCHASTATWATTSFNHALAAPPVHVGDHSCANCHRSGGSGLPKPSTHVTTSGACDNCHTNFNAFKPAHMDHTGTTGTCATCHSGGFASVGAQGKSASHIPTGQQCDACHTSFIAFRPASMNHTGTAGTCSTCHSGAYVADGALAKPATHVVTSAQCDSCHRITSSWIPALVGHDSSATRRCSVCHNSVNATGKGATHIPDNRQCDTCHTNFTAFRPALMSHVGLTGQCSTCHNGAYLSENAQAKSPTHVATNAQCDSSGCHASTISWATTTVDHALLAPPVVLGDHSCATCHRTGGSGLPMPTNHIPTAAACDTCHSNFGAFRPAFMSHTGTTGQCSTCHNGSYTAAGNLGAQAKPVGHIPTSMQCDSCHAGFVAFTPATMNHTGTNGACSTCHNGAYVSVGSQGALPKHSTHMVTSAQCDSSGCHSSTTTWTGVTFNHTGVTIGGHTCANAGCHIAGGSALPKPINHVPTTAACDTCHTNFITFQPASMSHAGTNGQCSTCHNGGYLAQNAQAKSVNHLPTSAQCDSSGCHSTANWIVTFNHATYQPPIAIGGHTCANAGCHTTGGNGLQKSPSHIATTGACDNCHQNFIAFSPATAMSHTGITTQCASCHNNTSATGKPPGRHIPTNSGCEVCHRTTAWLPLLTPYSHAGVATGSCVNCHSPGYTDIDSKPGNHIPTSFACDQCHRTTAWLPPIKPYSHAGVAPGSCKTCHTAPYTSITLMPGNHIPTTAVTANWASCDACHKSYSTFTGVRLHSTVFTSASQYKGTCAICHEWGNPYGLEGREPGEHKTTARMAPNSCDNSGCHTVRSF